MLELVHVLALIFIALIDVLSAVLAHGAVAFCVQDARHGVCVA